MPGRLSCPRRVAGWRLQPQCLRHRQGSLCILHPVFPPQPVGTTPRRRVTAQLHELHHPQQQPRCRDRQGLDLLNESVWSQGGCKASGWAGALRRPEAPQPVCVPQASQKHWSEQYLPPQTDEHLRMPAATAQSEKQRPIKGSATGARKGFISVSSTGCIRLAAIPGVCPISGSKASSSP